MVTAQILNINVQPLLTSTIGNYPQEKILVTLMEKKMLLRKLSGIQLVNGIRETLPFPLNFMKNQDQRILLSYLIVVTKFLAKAT